MLAIIPPRSPEDIAMAVHAVIPSRQNDLWKGGNLVIRQMTHARGLYANGRGTFFPTEPSLIVHPAPLNKDGHCRDVSNRVGCLIGIWGLHKNAWAARTGTMLNVHCGNALNWRAISHTRGRG